MEGGSRRVKGIGSGQSRVSVTKVRVAKGWFGKHRGVESKRYPLF